jgi:DNA-binding response OmpR family regulator
VAKAKILIIEDDPDISGLLGLRLKRNDYDTAFASDAVTAMTVARKERPDLILLDIGLPGGGGMLVMERLKAIAPLAHVPIIVVSARDAASTEEHVLRAGAQAFLPKPIEMERLLTAVRTALGETNGP